MRVAIRGRGRRAQARDPAATARGQTITAPTHASHRAPYAPASTTAYSVARAGSRSLRTTHAAALQHQPPATHTTPPPHTTRETESFGTLTLHTMRPLTIPPHQVIQQIAKVFGPPLDATATPQLHAIGCDLIARLATAFATLSGTTQHIQYQLQIYDSAKLNAGVTVVEERYGKERVHLISLTTGLFACLFADVLTTDPALPANVDAAVAGLAGALAHELAHPLDDLDQLGLSKRWGETVSYQACEMRADIEGIQLCRAAHLSPTGLYEALQAMVAGERRATGIVANTTGTHPAEGLRQCTLRNYLTQLQYAEGDPDIEPLHIADIAALRAELARFVPPPRKWFRLVTPPTIEAAIEALQACGRRRSNKRDYFFSSQQQRRFTFLVTCLDRFVLAAGDTITAAQRRHLFTFYRDWTNPTRHYPPLQHQYEDEPADQQAAKYGSDRQHYAAISQAPFYRSTAFRRWLRRTIAQGIAQDIQRVRAAQRHDHFLRMPSREELCYGAARCFRRIAPPDILLDIVGPTILRDMRHWPRQTKHHMHLYPYQTNFLKGLDDEFEAELAARFHAQVFPTLSQRERQWFAKGQDGGSQYYRFLFPRLVWWPTETESRRRPFPWTRVLALFDARRYPTRRAGMTRWAHHVWRHRGEYAVQELAAGSGWPFDWELVFHLLAIDPTVGWNALEPAVRRFTRSQGYVRFLETLHQGPAERRRTSIGGQPSRWARSDLTAALAGNDNPHLAPDSPLRPLARRTVAGTYLAAHPAWLAKHYCAALARHVAESGSPRDAAGFLAVHNLLLQQAFHVDSWSVGHGQHLALTDAIAEGIAALPLTADQRRKLLRSIFIREFGRIEDTTFAPHWLHDRQPVATTVLIYDALLASGAISGPSDLLAQLVRTYQSPTRNSNARTYPFFLGWVTTLNAYLQQELDTLAAEPDRTARCAQLCAFAQHVLAPPQMHYPHGHPDEGHHRLKSRVVELGLTAQFTPEEASTFFDAISATGATKDTDRFLTTVLLPQLAVETATQRATIERLLREKRVADRRLQVILARRVMEPEIAALATTPLCAEPLNALIQRLDTLVATHSMDRDQYLEDLAWRLACPPELISRIEAAKQIDWRKLNPLLVNMLSFISTYVQQWAPDVRRAMIAYLQDPDGRGLPPLVDAAVRPSDGAMFKNDRETAIHLFVTQVQHLRAEERVPLIDLLLHAGRPSLLDTPEFPRTITRELLHYAPDGVEEQALCAFLEIIPPHERSVSLAYLLSIQNEGRRGIKAIFEVFAAPGRKTGQRAAMFWTAAPAATRAELADLKDRAQPLTLAEIYRRMAETLTPEERRRIRRPVRILGSASTRTAVLVELHDGRHVVMLAQPAHAHIQVATNLRRGRAFLHALERRGFADTTRFFGGLLDATEIHLQRELAMSTEAHHLRTAAAQYAAINERLRPHLAGWRFVVPQLVPGFVVRDSLLFIEYLPGVAFHRLPDSADRDTAGEAIGRALVHALFHQRLINVDPHAGNYLIDSVRRQVGVIDWGEVEELQSRASPLEADDHYHLAQWLVACARRDPRALTRAALRLSTTPTATPEQYPGLVPAITTAMAQTSTVFDTMVAIANAVETSGLRLELRFGAGALLALLILASEHYAPATGPGSLKRLLTAEIGRTLLAKAPRTLADLGARLIDSV
ncbi:MAG: hypothetical protein HY696_09270 [Deltaproteobacteria bacterium]|nr:hypothetical protein [Deltaproteobacteria bacterium]